MALELDGSSAPYSDPELSPLTLNSLSNEIELIETALHVSQELKNP